MADETWWRDGVLYQIYPRSFADADGDGIGDLRGIADAPRPPRSGSASTGSGSTRRCRRRTTTGATTSATTPPCIPISGRSRTSTRWWPRPASAGSACCSTSSPTTRATAIPGSRTRSPGRDARHRDCYVWADPAPGGGPPNNWESNFGGSAWELHEPTGQCFLKNFLPTQPDLNWWNEEVRAAFDDVLRFWFARGIAGFRIDVCHAIVKDRELRDDPAVHRGRPSRGAPARASGRCSR